MAALIELGAIVRIIAALIAFSDQSGPIAKASLAAALIGAAWTVFTANSRRKASSNERPFGGRR